jgi:small subunit ribosomal protein S20|tara:strand:- start:1664 stop:1927 length:264 start_codon:yes stop_codon:yes gene_type:complete
MPQHKSAEKRVRRNEERRKINKSRISRIRSFIRIVEDAISAGDKKAATDALKNAQPEMQRGVTKGVLHKNTVSRKLSRLSARIKALK